MRTSSVIHVRVMTFMLTCVACLFVVSVVILQPRVSQTREYNMPKIQQHYNVSKMMLNSKSKISQEYNTVGIAADDQLVVNALRTSFLVPPSVKPYNLVHNSSYNPSIGQGQIVDTLLSQKRNGFFVEVGGFDGESYSNTLFLERNRGWSGILVEPDVENFNIMQQKNRKAYTAHSCLAETPYPKKVLFQRNYYAGRIMQDGDLAQALNGDHQYDVEYVQCFPLYTFLAALNVTKVDYFSLDVEGSEYYVLKNIPWEKVDISILSVEYHSNYKTYDKILDLMKKFGYVMHQKVMHFTGFADDFIFVKKSLLGVNDE